MQKAVEMFKQYDTNCSGGLDRGEFSRLHADVGGSPQGLEVALQALDKDGNNKISFIEFLKWLNWIDVSELWGGPPINWIGWGELGQADGNEPLY